MTATKVPKVKTSKVNPVVRKLKAREMPCGKKIRPNDTHEDACIDCWKAKCGGYETELKAALKRVERLEDRVKFSREEFNFNEERFLREPASPAYSPASPAYSPLNL